MKKFYFVGLVIILMMAVGLIGYGAYLNKTDENQIEMRMESRTVPLQGEKAKFRNLQPIFVLETINLTSEEIADAVALIDGRIEKSFVQKNSAVDKGQVLFELVNEDIPIKLQQAESAIAKAEAQVLQSRNSFARYERLREKNATSLEKYDEAKLNFEAAQANLREAQAQKSQLLVQDSRQNVVAPIEGEVLILYKQIGAFVTAGTPIALVGNFSRLSFSLPVEDAQAKKISVGERFELNFKNSRSFQKAYDTEYGAGNLGNEQTFPVFVKEIIPNLNQAAEMRKIIFEIDNRARILEQQTYNGVELIRTSKHNALTVPLGALNETKEFVFVVKENILERRKVEIGADDGKFAEIISGLREGEVVVTSATKGLEDGTKVEITLVE
ncbi:MAG: efflux RND transporter periplasmic adaptor subunit [Selenomonadaceae bacterium]|nr:efflux RND transporter periplasmic adaptor subunit [Selenomonadaceae bacterium]